MCVTLDADVCCVDFDSSVRVISLFVATCSSLRRNDCRTFSLCLVECSRAPKGEGEFGIRSEQQDFGQNSCTCNSNPNRILCVDRSRSHESGSNQSRDHAEVAVGRIFSSTSNACAAVGRALASNAKQLNIRSFTSFETNAGSFAMRAG